MPYLSTIVDAYDDSVDDEYERLILHRSSTIHLRLVLLGTLVCAAVLAWVLPGVHSLWSVLPLAPVLVGEYFSQRWMSARVPRPRALRPRPGELAVAAGALLALLIGIWHHTADVLPGFGSGAVVGGLVGAVIAVVAVPRILARTRRKDARRLDEELGDD